MLLPQAHDSESFVLNPDVHEGKLRGCYWRPRFHTICENFAQNQDAEKKGLFLVRNSGAESSRDSRGKRPVVYGYARVSTDG
jgi:hypothetical protein